jgi:GTP 3',8-cyclase
MIIDTLTRPLKDLRVSLTDRCNLRCRYCMPVEIFGSGYAFLPESKTLSIEEIARLTSIMVSLGVDKVRLTGGEPLMRNGVDNLVAMISSIQGVDDLAMTTNGILLSHHAESLALAGLHRVTVSLDAIDPIIFGKMNGVGAKVDRVLAGINAAQIHGLGLKVNAVIQRCVNESEILPLVRWTSERSINLRFIEFMDVGETNRWKLDDVVTAAEILEKIHTEIPLEKIPPLRHGEVATRYRFVGSDQEIGIISSVSKPFCRDCNRARISADGKLFTCLFTAKYVDLLSELRSGGDDQSIRKMILEAWKNRDDRYSELRGNIDLPKAEMSYLGG